MAGAKEKKKRESKYVDSQEIEAVEKFAEIMELDEPDKEVDELIAFTELIKKIDAGEEVPVKLKNLVDELKKSQVVMEDLMVDIPASTNIVEFIKSKCPKVVKFMIVTDDNIAFTVLLNKPRSAETAVVYLVDDEGRRVWIDTLINKNVSPIHVNL
jgi:hypothetical protein